MYCPNCGSKTSADQNFCRACGLSLDKIAASLHEQTPAKIDRTLLQQKERYEKLGVAALSVFGLGVLGFIIYGVVIKLLASGNIFDALAITGFIVMIACGLASVILFAKAKDAGDAAAKRPSQPQVAAGGESTKELLTEGNFEPVPSVTDRTTELLVVEKRERS